MNQLKIHKNLISKEEISNIAAKVLEHVNYHINDENGIFCNLVLVPQKISPIFIKQIFGDKTPFLNLIYRKNGSLDSDYDSNYLTKVIGYDIFSPKSLEDLVLENMQIRPQKDSLPLFSNYHILRYCNDYWSNSKTREISFPLFYSEILERIDKTNSQIFDWNLLAKRYNQRVKELELIQGSDEISQVAKKLLD